MTLGNETLVSPRFRTNAAVIVGTLVVGYTPQMHACILCLSSTLRGLLVCVLQPCPACSRGRPHASPRCATGQRREERGVRQVRLQQGAEVLPAPGAATSQWDRGQGRRVVGQAGSSAVPHPCAPHTFRRHDHTLELVFARCACVFMLSSNAMHACTIVLKALHKKPQPHLGGMAH